MKCDTKVQRLVVGIFAVCTLLISESSGVCSPFPDIAETNYDMNYSSINDVDKRPLGFTRSTVLFNDPESEDPCFSVNNLTARSVEVMFETVPAMKLCLRDQAGSERCGEGRFQECLEASAETMTFTFYCEVSSGCSESDVNFWVRITRGLPQVEDPEGMWCQWRNSMFPESLATLPPSFTPAPTLPANVDGSTSLMSCVFLLSSLATFVLAYIL